MAASARPDVEFIVDIRPPTGLNLGLKNTRTTTSAEHTFEDLGLIAQLVQALQSEGYSKPTPIQQQAIPPALSGRDILGCAQTGTGKTAAFALPILQMLTEGTRAKYPKDRNRRGAAHPQALVLSPVRELASQIDDSFATYGQNLTISHTAVYGGVSQYHQVRALERGIDVLVATPGRLLDLIEQRYVDLSGVKFLILDEADRMLDMGFIDPIRQIASMIHSEHQTMLFSATMPRQILQLAHSLLKDPVHVEVEPQAATVDLIEQIVYLVRRDDKANLLMHLLNEEKIERALVFTRTKHGADKLSKFLTHSGVNADAIHGNKAQGQRERALKRFRAGMSPVLVATDVAARGIDVDGISHVFNYDMPNEPEAYVHRIGRTGRAGAKGVAIAFCESGERRLLRDIEYMTRAKITPKPLPMYDRVQAPVESHREHSPSRTRETHREHAPSQSQREHAPREFEVADREPVHHSHTRPHEPARSQGHARPHAAPAHARPPKKEREHRFTKKEHGTVDHPFAARRADVHAAPSSHPAKREHSANSGAHPRSAAGHPAKKKGSGRKQSRFFNR